MQEMEFHREHSLARYRGRHIKVAIVDSGIDGRHPKLAKLGGGIELAVNKEGRVISGLGTALTDRVGHGTACAGIVHRIAPAAEIFSVRILDEEMTVDGRLLVAALRWAIEQRMDVVNLSLGTTEESHREELERVCREAVEQRVILVAARHAEGLPSYPALLQDAIGVVGGPLRGYGAFYYRENAEIECIARGDTQRVCWVDRREITRQGTSFSAPHVTGAIALLREKMPQATLAHIRELLRAHALNQKCAQTATAPKAALTVKEAQPKTMRKAVLYPYGEEMQTLVRFQELLPFEIVGVADSVGRGLLGRDAGEAIGIPHTGVSIGANWQCDGREVDTLVLGRIADDDLLREYVERALTRAMHVFSFSPLSAVHYADLYALAESRGRRLRSPWIDGRRALAQVRQGGSGMVDVPVIGVFGTSLARGKFELQLSLRRQFLQRGYRLGQLGTEPSSRLFGVDFCFPMSSAAGLCLPLQYYPEFLLYQMHRLSSRHPDLVLVGCQAGTIPQDIEQACSHALPALAFLLGTRPDACILVVSGADSDAHIENTLVVLHSIGKTKVLALAVDDERAGPLGGRHGLERGSSNELATRLEYVESRFSVPAVSIRGGEEKLLELVEDYFAAEQGGRCLRRSA